MKTIKRFAWVTLGLLVLEMAHAASFDCAKATTAVEKIICSDTELSRLDEELSAAYKTALKDVKHAEAIKQSQRQWLKSRLSACNNGGCVKDAYERRLSWLKFPFMTTSAGRLIVSRESFTATLLPSGKVLITGGCCYRDGLDEQPRTLPTAGLFGPETGRSTATGNLVDLRDQHSATLLPNGKVLVSGGVAYDANARMSDPNSVTDVDSAELYDPASGSFSTVNGFPPAYIITPLASGKVLFAGRVDNGLYAKIFDPATGRFTPTANPPIVGRSSATLLKNGQVLLVGGEMAELYNPAMNRFTETGKLLQARNEHSATLLNNGKVLVVGGHYHNASRHSIEFLRRAELYDPATGRFSPTGDLVTPRFNHRAILLPSGKVLIAGGGGADGKALASVEFYDPDTGKFSFVGNLGSGCFNCTFTLLKNGKVLIIDGTNATIYDPAAIDN